MTRGVRSLLAALMALPWLTGVVCAADLNTSNDSQTIANPDMYQAYVSAPASCTGANSGADLALLIATGIDVGPVNLAVRPDVQAACNERGEAAVTAASNNTFFSDTTWSDLDHNIVGLDVYDGFADSQDADKERQSSAGASWIPERCDTPSCGFNIRGDMLQYVYDPTPGDPSSGDEYAYSMNEQFTWGVAALATLQNNGAGLDDYIDGMPLAVAHFAVRSALGRVVTDVDAPGYGTCTGKIELNLFDPSMTWADVVASQSCLDGDDKAASLPLALAGRAGDNFDDSVWGRCDPDNFAPDPGVFDAGDAATKKALVTGVKQQMQNCLMQIATTPLTGPITGITERTVDPYDARFDPVTGIWSDGVTTQDFSWTTVRENLVDQAVLGYIHNNHDIGGQDFMERVAIDVGFRGSIITEDALYINDWRVTQTDKGDNTYNYLIDIAASTMAVGRDCAPTPGDPNCFETNTTLASFWGLERQMAGGSPVRAANGEIAYNYDQDMGLSTVVTEAGVNQTENLAQLYSQSVEGYLFGCMNCDTPELIGSGGSHAFDPYWDQPEFIPYTSNWHSVPTITHAPGL